MGAGEGGEIITTLIIHNNLLPVPLLQHFFSFFGGGKVGEAGLPLLQSLAIESIVYSDVNSALDMTNIVGDERSTVEQEEVLAVFSIDFLQFLGQTLIIDGGGLVDDEGSLQGDAGITG